MLALAVGIGWGYVSYHEHSWEALTTRISAPEGQRVNLKLQDGTEVCHTACPAGAYCPLHLFQAHHLVFG